MVNIFDKNLNFNLRGDKMKPEKKYYQINAEQVIQELNKRNMEGYYCATKEEATHKVLELIEDEASVSWGGSMTLQELGLREKINNGDYEVYDRADADNEAEKEAIYHQALSCDYYLMSTNALTRTGKLVNTDGRGNRVAALVYGPQQVIVVAGMNKLTADEAAARQRIKNQAAPLNALRLDMETPCREQGHCFDCQVEDSICCQTVITRRSRQENRIKVVLVGEKLGY